MGTKARKQPRRTGSNPPALTDGELARLHAHLRAIGREPIVDSAPRDRWPLRQWWLSRGGDLNGRNAATLAELREAFRAELSPGLCVVERMRAPRSVRASTVRRAIDALRELDADVDDTDAVRTGAETAFARLLDAWGVPVRVEGYMHPRPDGRARFARRAVYPTAEQLLGAMLRAKRTHDPDEREVWAGQLAAIRDLAGIPEATAKRWALLAK